MSKEYNNDFFGWRGSIARKNYIINLLILTALYFSISLFNFQVFEELVPYKFIYTILIYSAEILKIVIVMSIISLIYRRIEDFSASKSVNFRSVMRKLFIFLYFLPVLYIYAARPLLYLMPAFIQAADYAVFFGLIPAAFVCAVIFCFIKGA